VQPQYEQLTANPGHEQSLPHGISLEISYCKTVNVSMPFILQAKEP